MQIYDIFFTFAEQILTEMMKKVIFGFLMLVAALACHHGPGHSPREQEARDRAAQAAAAVVATDHADTLALQQAILDAKAQQSEYTLMGDTVAVRVFEESFRDHLRQHDQSLFQAIFSPNP